MWITSYFQTRASNNIQYAIEVTAVRTYLIRWSKRNGPGSRGLCGRNETWSVRSGRSPFMSRTAWRAWPPKMSSDGARMQTGGGLTFWASEGADVTAADPALGPSG